MATEEEQRCDQGEVFSFPTSIILVMFWTNLAGTVTNYISFKRIAKNFDNGRIIFRLLQIDALLSLAGCLCSVAISPALYFTNGIVICTVKFVAALCPMLFGLLISALLSVMRYLSLKHGHKDAQILESWFRTLAYLALGLFTSGTVVYFVLHLTIIKPFKVIGFCIEGTCAEPSHPASGGIIGIVMLATCLTSLVFAALTSKSLKNQVAAINKNSGIKGKSYTVPTRATILSVAVMIVIGILVPVSQTLVPSEEAFLTPYILIYLVNAFRCPLATFFTFAAKQAADKKTKEARQQWEMEQAKAARVQRGASEES